MSFIENVEVNILEDPKYRILYKINEISLNRGVIDLLPSQIYALITSFLRGKPELIGLSIDELNEKIDDEIKHSSHYRVYGESNEASLSFREGQNGCRGLRWFGCLFQG